MQNAVPNFSVVLQQARQQLVTTNDFYQQLFGLFGYPQNTPMALAALSALAEGLPAEDGYWLFCDLIQLRADLAAVFLLQENIPLSLPEHEQLQQEVRDYFNSQQLTFHVSATHRWYLQLAADPEIISCPPLSVLGKNIMAYLPEGRKRSYWRSLMTELQMLLHQSSVNQQRQKLGAAPINGIWFWGEGSLPKSGHNHWQKMWSDNSISTGLALLNRVKVAELPEKFERCLLEMQQPGAYLMVLTNSNSATFAADCFANILNTLRQQQLDELTIYSNDGKIYTVNAKQLQPWWRRILC